MYCLRLCLCVCVAEFTQCVALTLNTRLRQNERVWILISRSLGLRNARGLGVTLGGECSRPRYTLGIESSRPWCNTRESGSSSPPLARGIGRDGVWTREQLLLSPSSHWVCAHKDYTACGEKWHHISRPEYAKCLRSHVSKAGLLEEANGKALSEACGLGVGQSCSHDDEDCIGHTFEGFLGLEIAADAGSQDKMERQTNTQKAKEEPSSKM
eukprot:g50216.t1